jgi:acetyl-CoA C-acetyltransferase
MDVASLTHPVEYRHGVPLPAFAWLAARAYLDRTDATRESLAAVAVKNYRNALDNPDAQFQTAVDIETVLSSPVVADPLRLYDYCPVTDGAAALLFCPVERARDHHEQVVRVAGRGDRHARRPRAAGPDLDGSCRGER